MNRDMLTGLSRFQRLLLVTDGTVTEMLEQYLGEQIKVQKLHEKIEHNIQHTFPFHQTYLAPTHMPVLKREVLLQGQQSLQNWVHAESSIILNHLEPSFCHDLLNSRAPIGRLWEQYQIETFKRILNFEYRPAALLATTFKIEEQDQLISRTYSVYSNRQLIMLITETFPVHFFQD